MEENIEFLSELRLFQKMEQEVVGKNEVWK